MPGQIVKVPAKVIQKFVLLRWTGMDVPVGQRKLGNFYPEKKEDSRKLGGLQSTIVGLRA